MYAAVQDVQEIKTWDCHQTVPLILFKYQRSIIIIYIIITRCIFKNLVKVELVTLFILKLNLFKDETDSLKECEEQIALGCPLLVLLIAF